MSEKGLAGKVRKKAGVWEKTNTAAIQSDTRKREILRLRA